MQSDKPDSLATFVERHRADFDVHEPRPDLWAAIERDLAGPAAVPAAAPLPGAPTLPALAPAARAPWLHRYGVAAALALLVVAAGASEAWKAGHHQPGPEPGIAAEPGAAAPAGPLYLGDPLALAAADRNDLTDDRLLTAVRGMESYYVAQLNERKAELRQLADSAAGSPTAEWRHDLAALDSSYHTLKLELPHHPQPDVVLTAMNRNLQIRLDLLDRQLQTRAMTEARPAAATGLVLADSRSYRQP
ncbi:hypothetical protein [Hymenobacter sp. PAMC 26628]|uniref:hypothetical protein n=1 Tax=Hymenobacter sp. PAMC 26628 TaxID=1484118 RepID=UPI0007704C94|nr:hypothetical protein [Hymenobacter sp. PAMC 26628]AMJ67032.1 hypothetical protein AXW84_17535 [Hymenobacter sp. PAMC 26628]